jgi:hypothetical protein
MLQICSGKKLSMNTYKVKQTPEIAYWYIKILFTPNTDQGHCWTTEMKENKLIFEYI